MDLKRIDHIVLVVLDMEKSISFYSNILDMRVKKEGENIALRFGCCKINLHTADTKASPVAANPTYGSQDFCIIAQGNIQQIYRELQNKQAPFEPGLGIVSRTGALGAMKSIYLRDPDQNLVEISVYNNRHI